MASAIQTVGMIAFAAFMVVILALATISKINERGRGRRKEDGGGGDFRTDASHWGSSDSPTDSSGWGS